jgi:hypothetical protein
MTAFSRTLAALVLVALPLTAQAQIATWHFNTLTDATVLPGPIAPDAATAGVTVGPLALGPGLRHFLVRTYMNSPVGAVCQRSGGQYEAGGPRSKHLRRVFADAPHGTLGESDHPHVRCVVGERF